MERESERIGGADFDLSQFEKSLFFKGKLMTPRDMETEQEYHRERSHTINRFLHGTGIVRGLEIRSVSETSDGLDVTVSPGLAIDGTGRPIIVEQVTTKSVPRPNGDEAHVFIQFQEATIETVPVPDAKEAIDEDTAANRAVEVFELTCREMLPDETGQDRDIGLTDESLTGSREIEQALTEQYRDYTPGGESNPSVYLGSFERTPDGNWVESEESASRSFVFDLESLFSIIVNHISNTNNPHHTPVTKEPMDVPEDVEAIMAKLDSLETAVGDLEQDRRDLTRYVKRKSIKDRIRYFEQLAEQVETQSGETSRLARKVAERSRDQLESFEQTSYRSQLRELLELLISLGEQLESATTEKSLEAYLRAVSELQSALEDDAPTLEIVDAHEDICEAIYSMDALVDVVPDE